MLKQINKYDLRLGMYIHDLNCEWIKHPFFRRSFMLREDSDLAQILTSGIGRVWIDTVKGLDTSPGPADPGEGPEPDSARTARNAATFQEELPTARRILREANRIIHSVLTDVRMGRQVRMGQLQPVVLRITGSVLRNRGTLVSLCRLREADHCTFQHSVSACALLVMFGHHLGMDEAALPELGMGGMLHDVGKMRVPNHILNKPGTLTDTELAIMRSHVRLGLETLAQTPGISAPVVQVAGEHHERCDGSGYPNGLAEGRISRLGRMAAIVDVYDATTSNRVYHHCFEPAAALRRLYERAPGQFDLDLVQQFIQAIGIYPAGSLVRLKSERLAVVIEQNPGRLLRPRVRVVYDLARDQGLPPFDLDLSRPEEAGEDILGYEEPGAWYLDPNAYLNLEL